VNGARSGLAIISLVTIRAILCVATPSSNKSRASTRSGNVRPVRLTA